MLKAITALLLFIGTQLVCSALALLWLNADRISAGQPLDYGLLLQQPAASGVALFWGSLLLIGLLTATRLARRSSLQSLCQLPRRSELKALAALLCFAVGESLILAPFDLADHGTTLFFDGMKHNLWCLLLLCLAGPVSEEMVFRESILRHLARRSQKPVAAAAVSAVLFAAVHGNPAQSVPAAVVGFLLGLLYVRTGNVRLSSWAHVLNNSLAVALFFFPSADRLIREWPAATTVGAGTALCLLSLLLLWQWWRQEGISHIDLTTP